MKARNLQVQIDSCSDIDSEVLLGLEIIFTCQKKYKKNELKEVCVRELP